MHAVARRCFAAEKVCPRLVSDELNGTVGEPLVWYGVKIPAPIPQSCRSHANEHLHRAVALFRLR